MKIGFEQEFFIVNEAGLYVEVPKDIPQDGFPYLAEARGVQASTALDAAFNLEREVRRVSYLAGKQNLRLAIFDAQIQLPKNKIREVLRRTGKGASRALNMYGKPHQHKDGLITAGLHVHFSNDHEYTYIDAKGRECKYTTYFPLNIPRIIRALDCQFAEVIKNTKRQQGMYEMKSYGFEYRSLPTIISAIMVAEFLDKLDKS
jgi:hypothetical protein